MLTPTNASLVAADHHVALCASTSSVHQLKGDLGSQSSPSHACLRLLCPQLYHVRDLNPRTSNTSANAVATPVKVAQQSGGSREEYVSMEKLARVKKGAKYVFDQHAHHLPPVPSIPLVEATMVPAKPLFDPQTLEAGNPETIVSRPIYLQTGTDEVHSFAVDLSALHPDIIFSIVLSNTPGTDLAGKQSTTILVRNGVTATAARKSVGKKTKWFYHGKPMNDGDMRLFVSVGRDQMTFAYQEGGKWCVHGDCPVSKLKERDIGYVKRMPFYVTVYTKNKGTLKKEEEPAVVRFLDTQGQGWIHDGVEDEEEVAEELELEEEVEESDGGFEIIGHEEAREEQGAQEDEGLLGGLEGMSL
jgi:hypothetical protein